MTERRPYIPLSEYVRELRHKAADADWNGNTKQARIFEHEADLAVKRGEDPVCMF